MIAPARLAGAGQVCLRVTEEVDPTVDPRRRSSVFRGLRRVITSKPVCLGAPAHTSSPRIPVCFSYTL